MRNYFKIVILILVWLWVLYQFNNTDMSEHSVVMPDMVVKNFKHIPQNTSQILTFNTNNTVLNDSSVTPNTQADTNVNVNLQTYLTLSKKELFTQKELELFKKACSAIDIIDDVSSAIINYYQNKDWSEDEELSKMYLINFLAQGISWKTNPQREYIIDKILEIFWNDLFYGQDVKIKKSMIADKVELYQALYWYAPDVANHIVRDITTTDYQNIIRIAHQQINFMGNIFNVKQLQ